MAHYIAELMHDVETANVEDRPAKMRACSEAILNIWKQRHELPNGKRPFEEFEPILRTLESLDPDNDTPRYFRSIGNAAKDVSEDSETMALLKLVDGLDYSAKILIRYLLNMAAKSSLNQSADWVALAEAAEADEGIEFPVIRVMVGEKDLLEKVDPDEIARKQLQDRITRLDAFLEVAQSLSAEWRQRLEQFPSSRTLKD
jgi:hypothetical protein